MDSHHQAASEPLDEDQDDRDEAAAVTTALAVVAGDGDGDEEEANILAAMDDDFRRQASIRGTSDESLFSSGLDDPSAVEVDLLARATSDEAVAALAGGGGPPADRTNEKDHTTHGVESDTLRMGLDDLGAGNRAAAGACRVPEAAGAYGATSSQQRHLHFFALLSLAPGATHAEVSEGLRATVIRFGTGARLSVIPKCHPLRQQQQQEQRRDHDAGRAGDVAPSYWLLVPAAPLLAVGTAPFLRVPWCVARVVVSPWFMFLALLINAAAALSATSLFHIRGVTDSVKMALMVSAMLLSLALVSQYRKAYVRLVASAFDFWLLFVCTSLALGSGVALTWDEQSTAVNVCHLLLSVVFIPTVLGIDGLQSASRIMKGLVMAVLAAYWAGMAVLWRVEYSNIASSSAAATAADAPALKEFIHVWRLNVHLATVAQSATATAASFFAKLSFRYLVKGYDTGVVRFPPVLLDQDYHASMMAAAASTTQMDEAHGGGAAAASSFATTLAPPDPSSLHESVANGRAESSSGQQRRTRQTTAGAGLSMVERDPYPLMAASTTSIATDVAPRRYVRSSFAEGVGPRRGPSFATARPTDAPATAGHYQKQQGAGGGGGGVVAAIAFHDESVVTETRFRIAVGDDDDAMPAQDRNGAGQAPANAVAPPRALPAFEEPLLMPVAAGLDQDDEEAVAAMPLHLPVDFAVSPATSSRFLPAEDERRRHDDRGHRPPPLPHAAEGDRGRHRANSRRQPGTVSTTRAAGEDGGNVRLSLVVVGTIPMPPPTLLHGKLPSPPDALQSSSLASRTAVDSHIVSTFMSLLRSSVRGRARFARLRTAITESSASATSSPRISGGGTALEDPSVRGRKQSISFSSPLRKHRQPAWWFRSDLSQLLPPRGSSTLTTSDAPPDVPLSATTDHFVPRDLVISFPISRWPCAQAFLKLGGGRRFPRFGLTIALMVGRAAHAVLLLVQVAARSDGAPRSHRAAAPIAPSTTWPLSSSPTPRADHTHATSSSYSEAWATDDEYLGIANMVLGFAMLLVTFLFLTQMCRNAAKHLLKGLDVWFVFAQCVLVSAMDVLMRLWRSRRGANDGENALRVYQSCACTAAVALQMSVAAWLTLIDAVPPPRLVDIAATSSAGSAVSPMARVRYHWRSLKGALCISFAIAALVDIVSWQYYIDGSAARERLLHLSEVLVLDIGSIAQTSNVLLAVLLLKFAIQYLLGRCDIINITFGAVDEDRLPQALGCEHR